MARALFPIRPGYYMLDGYGGVSRFDAAEVITSSGDVLGVIAEPHARRMVAFGAAYAEKWNEDQFRRDLTETVRNWARPGKAFEGAAFIQMNPGRDTSDDIALLVGE